MTPKLEYKRGIYKDTANGNSDKIEGEGMSLLKTQGTCTPMEKIYSYQIGAKF